MTAYRPPDFRERAALSREAKQRALEKLRARPVVDDAELAARKAARIERETAAAEKKRADKEQAAAAREAEARDAEARAVEAAEAIVRSEAEKKAARDARYAARKNRK